MRLTIDSITAHTKGALVDSLKVYLDELQAHIEAQIEQEKTELEALFSTSAEVQAAINAKISNDPLGSADPNPITSHLQGKRQPTASAKWARGLTTYRAA